MEMAKQIKFEYKGQDYTLEFTRNTARQLENTGFKLEDIGNKPNIAIPLLFQASFLVHHKRIKQPLVNEIYNRLPNKDELIAKLAEMYGDTVNTLLADPEDDEGNIDWEGNW
jgi:hypothetical protein